MDGCRRPNHACNDVLIQFSEKVLEISGLGDRTFVPDSAFPLDLSSPLGNLIVPGKKGSSSVFCP